jgi:hypothetical protein
MNTGIPNNDKLHGLTPLQKRKVRSWIKHMTKDAGGTDPTCCFLESELDLYISLVRRKRSSLGEKVDG